MLFRLYVSARRCQSLRCWFTFLQKVMSNVRMLPAWTLVHTFCLVPSPVSLFIDPSRKLSTTGHTQYLAGLLSHPIMQGFTVTLNAVSAPYTLCVRYNTQHTNTVWAKCRVLECWSWWYLQCLLDCS